MKLVLSKVELLQQEPGIQGVYKQIELAGRTCYKSEDKITETSAKAFVNKMIESAHTAMLEHGTVYLYLEVNPKNCFSKFEYPLTNYTALYNWSDVVGSIKARYDLNKYSKVNTVWLNENKTARGVFITTNYRVIVENNWQDDLQFICEPTKYHEKRITLRFQANIHFYKDATRHRVNSYAIESTRFINYMKEKFGMSISFMKPSWIKQEDVEELKADCQVIENIYAKWIAKGYRAEQAAYFLCQGVEATVVITAFASDWKHFFDLRLFGTTGKPHPDMVDICEKARKILTENNLWEEIYESNNNNQS